MYRILLLLKEPPLSDLIRAGNWPYLKKCILYPNVCTERGIRVGVITISRTFGSGGDTIAGLVAARTGFLLVNKSFLIKGLSPLEGNPPPPNQAAAKALEKKLFSRKYLPLLHDFIYDLAVRENLVLLGRGGQMLFGDFPPSLHVKIIASEEGRVKRAMHAYKLTEEDASKLISSRDRNKKNYLKRLFDADWANPDFYHLILNTDKIDFEEAAEIITTAYRLLGEPQENMPGESEGRKSPKNIPSPKKAPSFMHPSEEKFAKMLDFYRIEWHYEPKTFPLEWNKEGKVTKAFSPDFYLPEQDIYVELTTQRQKLVWQKNKKMRRLKELYPHIDIRIIYNKDYKGLLRKFDLEEETNS